MHAINRAQALVRHLQEGNASIYDIELADVNGKFFLNKSVLLDSFNYYLYVSNIYNLETNSSRPSRS
jgi:hypothetical protein